MPNKTKRESKPTKHKDDKKRALKENKDLAPPKESTVCVPPKENTIRAAPPKEELKNRRSKSRKHRSKSRSCSDESRSKSRKHRSKSRSCSDESESKSRSCSDESRSCSDESESKSRKHRSKSRSCDDESRSKSRHHRSKSRSCHDKPKKRDRKHRSKSRSCHDESRSRSRHRKSKSRQRSIDSCSSKHYKPKSRTCTPSKKSCESKCSYSKESDNCKSYTSWSKSCSSFDCDKDLYKYLKYKLLKDENMMIGGSSAYGSFFSRNVQVINPAEPVVFETKHVSLNIDHEAGSSSVYVRASGLYQAIFAIETDEPCQFTYYVNDLELKYTTMGRNSGAGQLLIPALLNLNKNDEITIRNYQSSVVPVHTNNNAGGVSGGTDISTNTELVLYKMSPKINEFDMTPNDHTYRDIWDFQDRFINTNRFPNHLTEKIGRIAKYARKYKHKFREIKKRMLCDKSLDLENVAYGTFCSHKSQVINLNSPVIFERSDYILNMDFTINTSDVTIKKDGVYMLFFVILTSQAAQFTVYVNGVPDMTSTAGLNAGASNLTLRQTFILRAGDIVNIKNHTSAIGAVTTSTNPGGFQEGDNAILLLNKIAPLPDNRDSCVVWDKEKELECCEKKYDEKYADVPKKWKLLYNAYKYYLLKDKCLLAGGSNAYATGYTARKQSIDVNKPVIFDDFPFTRNIKHLSGTSDFRICEAGLYMLIFTAQTNEPSQFAVAINGVPDPNTPAGVDAGAAQVSIKQLVNLAKGDLLSIVNYTSAIGTVTLSQNAGGYIAGVSAKIIIHKVANLDNCTKPKDVKNPVRALKNTEMMLKQVKNPKATKEDNPKLVPVERKPKK